MSTGAAPGRSTHRSMGAVPGKGSACIFAPARFMSTAPRPGDVLEVRILDVQPRACRNPAFAGRAFGSNAAAWWGFHYNDLITEPKPREVVTIYELDDDGGQLGARGLQLPLGAADRPVRRRAPHDRLPRGAGRPMRWSRRITASSRACAFRSGRISGSLPSRPGRPNLSIRSRRAISAAMSTIGGYGKGAVMYYPVAVPGALFSVGDPHASQGDGELCGTAIECSLTGTFQLLLHKRDRLAGTMLADLDYPLLETGDEWVVHGFSFANYLAELGTRRKVRSLPNPRSTARCGRVPQDASSPDDGKTADRRRGDLADVRRGRFSA